MLEVEHLNFSYGRRSWIGQRRKQVLFDISFSLRRGEILGLVGESGCGKTTLGKLIVGMEKEYDGKIVHYTKRPQMIFQDPYGSLNPSKKAGWIVEEPLRAYGKYSKEERKKRVADMFLHVGLDPEYLEHYPRELSGGQRQRVAIATALIRKPWLVVADEPVSALDVTIQEQILELLVQVKNQYELSYLFISHDLNVIYEICDRVIVMKNGKIIEEGPVQDVYNNPKDEYTKRLIDASPS